MAFNKQGLVVRHHAAHLQSQDSARLKEEDCKFKFRPSNLVV